MFADFNFQQMISAFIVLFAVIDIIGYSNHNQFEGERKRCKRNEGNRNFIRSADRILLCRRYDVEAFSCRYRVFCCGRCFRHIPDVFGDDSRCRNIQESGTH